MKSGIHVGNTTKESIQEVVESILKILDAKADQKTLRYALDVFSKSVKIEHVSVCGNSIYMDKEKPDPTEDQEGSEQ